MNKKREPGGVTPPQKESLLDCWRPLFGMPPYIPEGRATFLALVPQRYLTPPPPKVDDET